MRVFLCPVCLRKQTVVYSAIDTFTMSDITKVELNPDKFESKFLKCEFCEFVRPYSDFVNDTNLELAKRIINDPNYIEKISDQHLSIVVQLVKDVDHILFKDLYRFNKINSIRILSEKLTLTDCQGLTEIVGNLFIHQLDVLAKLILENSDLTRPDILPYIVEEASYDFVKEFLKSLKPFRIQRIPVIEAFNKSISRPLKFSELILDEYQHKLSYSKLRKIVEVTIKHDSTAVLKLLINKGFPISNRDFFKASKYGSYACCKFLIESDFIDVYYLSGCEQISEFMKIASRLLSFKDSDLVKNYAQMIVCDLLKGDECIKKLRDL